MLLKLKDEYKNHFLIIINKNDFNKNDFKREKENNNIETTYVQLLIYLEDDASTIALQLSKKSKKISVLKCKKNSKPKTEKIFFIKILMNGIVYWANKEYFIEV